MDVLVLGCGEAFDDTLPNTSLLVDCGEVLLLDCGFSVPPQVWQQSPDPDRIDAIYVSHPHADHYFGLPALLTRMAEDRRTKPLILISHAAVLEQTPLMMELAYRGAAVRFPFSIEHRLADPDDTVAVGGATLRFAPTRHAVTNYAVRIESGGRSLCYSGDGMFTEESSTLYTGADLVFHEAYAFEESPVHADIPRLLEMVRARKLGRLALVHVQRRLRQSPERLVAAVLEGGKSVVLPEPLSRFAV